MLKLYNWVCVFKKPKVISSSTGNNIFTREHNFSFSSSFDIEGKAISISRKMRLEKFYFQVICCKLSAVMRNECQIT